MTDQSNINRSANNILKFENQVFSHLAGWGIEVKRDFSIPGSTQILDCYIAAPMRVVVEFKVGRVRKDQLLNKYKKEIDRLNCHFGGQIHCLFIGVGPEWESLSKVDDLTQLGMKIVHVPDISHKSSRQAAVFIRSQLNTGYDFHSRSLSITNRLNKLGLKIKYFGDVLISLRDILNTKSFKLLASEFHAFGQEYDHKHWTACALRLGRMNESLIYSIADYAGVNVQNKEFEFKTSAIHQIRNLMDQVQKELTNPSQKDFDEKIDKARDQYIKSLNKSIENIKKSFPNEHKKIAGAFPSDATVLEKISRKYKHLDRVQAQYLFITEIDPNNNIGILKKLKDFRNLAAHADAYGNVYEISKSDVDEHRPIIRLLLHYLTNIAFAIQTEKQKHFE